MKSLIVFALAACVAIVTAHHNLTDEQKEKAKAIKAECIAESHVDEEVLKKAKHDGVFDDEEKLSKFFACFGKKIGFMNDAGELQVDTIRTKITEFYDADVAEKVVAECTKEKHENIEKAALEFTKCSHKFKKDH